jgi:hypothetical protein
MAASDTSVKELYVLNHIHRASSRTNLRHVKLNDMKVFRKDKESDICKKTTANLSRSFGNTAVLTSSSKYDIKEN